MEIVDPNTIEINSEVMTLSLFDNKIEDINLVETLLHKLPCLRVLWLNDNPLSSEDVIYYIENLKLF
jgi:Leucine-rich repeat (LRR) protein